MKDDVRNPAPEPAFWSVSEAKAKFSHVLERADSDGPQIITRNGKPKVVILSAEDWEKQRPRGTLFRIMRSAPLAETELDFSNPPHVPDERVF
jgi:prevent-host-death family protein